MNVIQGLDLLDVIHFVSKKNKKFQAILLQDVEQVLGKDSQQYAEVRKLILDSYNSYTRSILRVIFGNDFDL
jgi:translation elongation factor EF-4